jgi:hypothetical protein
MEDIREQRAAENRLFVYKGEITWSGAMPQLRLLIARFSPWQPGFCPRQSTWDSSVNKVALGQVFSLSVSAYPRRHSAGASYLFTYQPVKALLILLVVAFPKT